MKNLFSKICAFALIGLFVGSASAVLVGPVRLNGGGSPIIGTAGTATFTVPGSPLGAYILRSVQVNTIGSMPAGSSDTCTVTIADQSVSNVLYFACPSNSSLSAGGRAEWVPGVVAFQTVSTTTVNGTNVVTTITANQTYTNIYIHPGASVTIAIGTNSFRANIEAEAFTGFNP